MWSLGEGGAWGRHKAGGQTQESPWSWLSIQGQHTVGPQMAMGRRRRLKALDLGLTWWSSSSDSPLPMQGAQVRSLVRELRFSMLYGVAKEKEKKKKKSSGSLDWSRGPAANVATVFGKMGASGLALPSLPSTHQLPERYAKYSI